VKHPVFGRGVCNIFFRQTSRSSLVGCGLAERAGYNYGRDPIPPENLSPLLAAITEQHLTVGFGLQLDDHWRTDVGVQYNIPNTVTYTNTALPFGANAQETNELLLVQLLLSRAW